MKVVLDTSCISTFIRINKVELLLMILEKHDVTITEQVHKELTLSKDEKLKNFRHPKINIKPANSLIADKYNIHIGEASVIMFAKESNALAVIDDKIARRAAEKEGIDFVGTATLIKLGIEKGIIKRAELGKLIEEVMVQGRLYLSEEIRKWIID